MSLRLAERVDMIPEVWRRRRLVGGVDPSHGYRYIDRVVSSEVSNVALPRPSPMPGAWLLPATDVIVYLEAPEHLPCFLALTFRSTTGLILAPSVGVPPRSGPIRLIRLDASTWGDELQRNAPRPLALIPPFCIIVHCFATSTTVLLSPCSSCLVVLGPIDRLISFFNLSSSHNAVPTGPTSPSTKELRGSPK